MFMEGAGRILHQNHWHKSRSGTDQKKSDLDAICLF